MLGVSAEQQAHLPMDSLSWSFFSEHCASPSSNGYSCSDSIFLKSSPVTGMNLSPQSSNAENTGSMFVGRSGMEDSRRELLARSLSLGSSRFNISEFPDTGSVEGLMFDSGYDNFDNASNSNGNGSCLIQKEGRCISVPMSNSFNSATTVVGSPGLNDAIAALQKFLPSNNEDEESWPAVDAYSCDEFRMYEFKVRRCMRGRSHDWTECPFAHPGEKARRRDPRRFHYSGTACPDFRKGSCRRGDACEFAHGVFECWLHPARYRTQPCKDGRNCRRRVCFFAHTPEQLRLLPGASSQNPQSHGVNAAASRSALHASALKNSLSGGSYDGSPLRHGFDGGAGVDGSNPTGYFDGGGSPRGYFAKASHANLCSSLLSSPTSTLVGHSQSPPPLSPPLSPSVSPPLSPDGPGEWSNGSVNYRISSPVKGAYQKALLSPSSLLQVQSSQAAAGNQNLCNISASLASNMLASSPVPAHRRHLDRLGSMPSITIPPPLDARGASSLRSSVLSSSVDASRPSSPGIQSPKVMTELMNSLQKFELNGSSGHAWLQTQAAVAGAHSSPRASNLRRCIHSQPCTPTKSSLVDNWGEGELMEEPVQRVESGRDLRAKIYGRLSKGNLQDSSESPDLGWVNELVK